jgi:Tol biopolymer transport system component
VAEVNPETGQSQISIVDLTGGSRKRLPSADSTNASPVWSPDGRRLVVRSNRRQVHDLFIRDAAGVAPDQVLYESSAYKYPTSWSPDGRLVLFHTQLDNTGWDVFVARTDRSVAPRPLLNSRFDEMQAQFSPNGKWFAYTSDESRQREVYIRRLDRQATRLQVSGAGGSQPQWRADGNELFYVAGDGMLMAVAINDLGETLEIGGTHRLFRMPDPMIQAPFMASYDAARDGQRFLVRTPVEDARSMPLTVLIKSMTPASSARAGAWIER